MRRDSMSAADIAAVSQHLGGEDGVGTPPGRGRGGTEDGTAVASVVEVPKHLEKYKKMRKLGVHAGGVRNKMKMDGIPESDIVLLLGPEEGATLRRATPPPKQLPLPPGADKYAAGAARAGCWFVPFVRCF
jgi:hypothetical protein